MPLGLARALLPLWATLVPVACAGPGFNRGVLGNLPGKSDKDLINTQFSRRHALTADISIGTPAQTLRCLLDSGSADLWVPSKLCKSCDNKHHFQAEKSSTFAPQKVATPWGSRPKQVSVSYGSGRVLGYDVQDTLQFGSVKVKNQSFIIVEEAQLPSGRSWDGICGLGWKQLAQVETPLYEHLQKMGHKAIFSLVPNTRTEAHMVVGEVPQKDIKSETLVWAKAEPIDAKRGSQHSFWVTSGGLAIRKKSPTPARFLVDTGTNQVLLVPPKVYRSFMNSLLPADTFHRLCGSDPMMGNLIACDCSIVQEEELPPLRIYLGNRAFPLTIKELFMKVPAKDGGEELCLLQIQPNSLASSSIGSILGGLLGPDPLVGGGRMPTIGGNGSFPVGNISKMPDMLGDLLGKIMNVSMNASGGNSGGILHGTFGQPGSILGGLMGELEEGVDTKLIETIKPDGSTCTTTLEYKDGKVQKNVTKCTPSKSVTTRRLQLLPPFVMPFQDPMEDIWVIGGVFLERYVTIFDFDNARIGFAEPVNPVFPQGLASPKKFAYLSDNPANAHWSWIATALVMLTVGVSLVGFYVWKKKNDQTDKDLPMYNRAALPPAESFELEKLEACE